ncbi:unnamed protein product [Lathyrus sativus]|nr:unnamed protein product [Lathyrus sativus]
MSETKMADWSATNQLVMSWLLNEIFPKISTSLIFKTSAKQMDEKKDKNCFTRLDYSGIFFFELASKAGSSELVYCVFYMDKPLLLWAGRPSVSMNGLTMSLQCLVESIASLFTHRRLFSSHRSRDTRPSFNYEQERIIYFR